MAKFKLAGSQGSRTGDHSGNPSVMESLEPRILLSGSGFLEVFEPVQASTLPAAQAGLDEVQENQVPVGALEVTIGEEAGNRVKYVDQFGVPVTISLLGDGRAVLGFSGDNLTTSVERRGLVVSGQNITLDSLTCLETGNRSSLRIVTRGRGVQTEIGSIHISGGSLRSITATTTVLVGDLVADGELGRLTLAGVSQGTIDLDGVVSTGVVMKLGRVEDLFIDSASPIRSLVVTDWQDTLPDVDLIQAPWIGSLSARGNRRAGIDGDFQADITLSETPLRGRTLNSARIVGNLSEVQWDIGGDVGSLYVSGMVSDSEIRSSGSMGNLSFGRINGSNVLAGISADVEDYPADRSEYSNLDASIRSIRIAGIRPAVGEIAPRCVIDGNFAAATIGRVTLTNVAYDNGGQTFGLFATTRVEGREIGLVIFTDTVTGERWRWSAAEGDSYTREDLNLMVYPAVFELLPSATDISVVEGGTAQFTVSLSAQPIERVIVTVSRTGGDTDVEISSGQTLLFDESNWDEPQTVTLSAAEDADTLNGVAEFTIQAEGATNQPVVTATETDEDFEIVTSVSSLTVPEGSSAGFTVALSSQPIGSVTVRVVRNSGDSDLSVSEGGTLVFDAMNWDQPQTVTIAAQADSDADDGVAQFIVQADGSADQTTIVATEVDDDFDLITSVSGLSVAEGATGQFTVVLSARPAGEVTVQVTRDSGDEDLSVSSGGTLVFDPSNWDQPQTVTIAAGEDDDSSDGSAEFTVQADGAADQPTITATEVDNDFDLIASVSELTVGEGSTGQFTVVLSARPAGEVTVQVTRDSGDEDLSVSSGGTLVFDQSNWDQPQTVTIAAAEDDDYADDTAEFLVQADGASNQLTITASEDDNDVILPGISLMEVARTTIEGIDYVTYDLIVSSPSDWTNQRLDFVLTSGSIYQHEFGADFSPSEAAIELFPDLEWDTYFCTPSGAMPSFVSADSSETELHYSWFDTAIEGGFVDVVTARITVTADASGTATGKWYNTETVGVGEEYSFTINLGAFDVIASSSSLSVSEGNSAEFTVVLSARPGGEVTVQVTRDSGDEDLSVSSGGTLVFDQSNWDQPQTVTIAAAEDVDAVEGTAVFLLQADGADNQPTVTVAEVENDMAGVGIRLNEVARTTIEGTDYVTYDLIVSSTSDWTNQRLDFVLTSGSIYQSDFGADFSPSEAAIELFPDLEWDTYFCTPSGAMPAFVSADSSETELHYSWFDTAIEGGFVDVVTARITVTADASGTATGKWYNTDTVGVGEEYSFTINAA